MQALDMVYTIGIGVTLLRLLGYDKACLYWKIIEAEVAEIERVYLGSVQYIVNLPSLTIPCAS